MVVGFGFDAVGFFCGVAVGFGLLAVAFGFGLVVWETARVKERKKERMDVRDLIKLGQQRSRRENNTTKLPFCPGRRILAI